MLDRLRDDDPEPPPLTFGWMAVRAMRYGVSIDELVSGSSVALVVNGETLVGELRHVGAKWITWRPWGRGVEHISRASVAAARLIGPHSWAEAREVSRRQAEGAKAM
jgi:hypothetical protein